MSAVEQVVHTQYRVQAYKKVISSGATGTYNSAPCMTEEADHFWIERLIGPNRWQRVEMKDTEDQALGRLAELSPVAIEKTHYGYSTPRR
jgi:hypothetical protein